VHRGTIADSQTPPQWAALGATDCNAVIVGGDVAVVRILTHVWPSIARPVFWCTGRSLRLPLQPQGTVILQNVQLLDGLGQIRLLRWLTEIPQQPRLIATTPSELLPLVNRESFSRLLYERLSAIEIVAEQV
jgi:hypothetical protein